MGPAHGRTGGSRTVSANSVLSGHGRRCDALKALRDEAGVVVGRTARGEGHDDFHRLAGVSLRGGAGGQGCRGQAQCKKKSFPEARQVLR